MKKRGFTLIELLAVIVILAIIALIATPIVMNVIENARKGAAERSAENYIDAVETAIATERLDNNILEGEYTIQSDGNLCKTGTTCTDETEIKIEMSGNKPTGGSVIIENGQVTPSLSSDATKKTTLSIGSDYEVSYDATKNAYVASIPQPMCTFEPQTELGLLAPAEKTVGAKYICDVGDGERAFYILELGSEPITNSTLSSNQVALIMDSNYGDVSMPWCATGTDNACNASGLTQKLEEIRGAWKKLNVEQIVLPSAYQIAAANGNTDFTSTGSEVSLDQWCWDNLESGSSYAEGYWTSTAGITSGAWRVSYNGNLSQNYVADTGGDGIRPVIIISNNDL